MKLHDLELSGNCYKVRLFLALLGKDCQIVPVDFLGGAHKSAGFRALNPLAQLPVLEDGDLVLRDSQAILVYLARKFGGEQWLPSDAEGEARVVQWLSTAANEIARGPNDARLHDLFGYDLDVVLARAKAHHILGIVNDHLASRIWLELGRPTIADLAVFPYIALAPQGGVALDGYPAIQGWISRIKALTGFIPMPGIA